MALRPRLVLLFPALVSAGCLSVRPGSLVPPRASSQREARSEFLDGRARSFVVVGDASSLVWPQMLQEMLDAHAKGVYRVLNGSEPEAGIGAWLRDEDGAALAALAMDFFGPEARLRRRPPAPTVALCQVSLAGVGDERGPVKSEHDMLGAELGAQALEQLALRLKGLGVERIVFATPLFQEQREPEAGLERVALERLLARGHAVIETGPDLHSASRRYYPETHEQDRATPNEFGIKLMAEEWYRWIAGPEAREEVVQALYAKDYDVERIQREHSEWRGREPRP
jgi:hypothetical protein